MSHILDYMELVERVDSEGNTLIRVIKYVKSDHDHPEMKTSEIVEDATALITEENHTNLGAIMDMLRAEKTDEE